MHRIDTKALLGILKKEHDTQNIGSTFGQNDVAGEVILSKRKVALFGWEPAAFFKYNSWPGLTEEVLKAQIEADIASLVAMGLDATAHYITAPNTAYDMVVKTLSAERFDVVLVGAGVRKVDANFILFEAIVNAIHAAAPHARICFNTNPADTADAVKRWI